MAVGSTILIGPVSEPITTYCAWNGNASVYTSIICKCIEIVLKPITMSFIISNKTAQINILKCWLIMPKGPLWECMEIYVVDVESQVAGYPTIQQRFSSTVAGNNSNLQTKF